MADTPYTGEFVAGDVMPTSGVTYDLSQLNQSIQSLVEANEQRKIRAEKRAEEQKERERKLKLDWDKLDLDAVVVWKQDQEYVNQKANEYAEYAANLELKYPEGRSAVTSAEKAELARLELEVMSAKKMADDNSEQAEKWISSVKGRQQDYDVDHYKEVMEEYLSPTTTAEQRYEMRMNPDPFSGPIVKSYNETDVIDMAKDYTGKKKEQKGNTITTYYDQADLAATILKQTTEGAGQIAYKQNRQKKTDASGTPVLDKDGNPVYEDEQEYADRLAKEAIDILATQSTTVRPPSRRRQSTGKDSNKYNWESSGGTLYFSKEGGGNVPTATADGVPGEITRFRKSGSDIEAYINVGGAKTWRKMTPGDITEFNAQFGVDLIKKFDETDYTGSRNK